MTPQGSPQREGPYVDGRPHGHWIFRYDDGTVMQECDYDKGSANGLWRTYWMNGNRQSEGHYDHNSKQGLWMRWHQNGLPKSRGEYQDDRKHGRWQYWNERGALQHEGAYRDGRRDGRWRFHLDVPEHAFAADWHQGHMTNRPGKPPNQPPAHKHRYYPMVPGQLPGFETPFERSGPASDVYFGWLRSGRRLTYLFRPVMPFTRDDAAGLFLVIWERYETLIILEKLYTATPDDTASEPFDGARDEHSSAQEFFVLLDPLHQATPAHFPASRCTTLRGAVRSARRLARKHQGRMAVGRCLHEYPLDF